MSSCSPEVPFDTPLHRPPPPGVAFTALGVRERLTLNCRNTRPIARQTVDFHPYHGRSGWLKELERLITELRRDNVPPGRISVLLLKTPGS